MRGICPPTNRESRTRTRPAQSRPQAPTRYACTPPVSPNLPVFLGPSTTTSVQVADIDFTRKRYGGLCQICHGARESCVCDGTKNLTLCVPPYRQHGVEPAERERVRQRNIDLHRPCLVRHVIEIARRIGSEITDG